MSTLAHVTRSYMSPPKVRSNQPTHRRPYPTEVKREMTAEWKQLAIDKLRELGKNHRWLEAEIGASRGSVTKMLGPDQNTSALVDRVCAALGIPAPTTATDATEQELIARYREASPSARAAAVAVLGLAKRSDQD